MGCREISQPALGCCWRAGLAIAWRWCINQSRLKQIEICMFEITSHAIIWFQMASGVFLLVVVRNKALCQVCDVIILWYITHNNTMRNIFGSHWCWRTQRWKLDKFWQLLNCHIYRNCCRQRVHYEEQDYIISVFETRPIFKAWGLPLSCWPVSLEARHTYTIFKLKSETCQTKAQFCPNLDMIKKKSLPDWPKFCRSGSTVWHLFWRLPIESLTH